MFKGDSLLYTDINIHNLMVGDGHVWVVDWAWPTRGAAFIDPALFVLQLIAEGHNVEAAESWVADCTAWVAADPKAIDAFASANLRMYRYLAGRRPEATWLEAMKDAAQAWKDYRGI